MRFRFELSRGQNISSYGIVPIDDLLKGEPVRLPRIVYTDSILVPEVHLGLLGNRPLFGQFVEEKSGTFIGADDS